MSTLRDVIDQLKENQIEQSADNLELINTLQEIQESFVLAITQSSEGVNDFILSQERQKLQERENRKEENQRMDARGGQGSGSSSSGGGAISNLFGLSLGAAGGIAARFLAPILSPIRSILRFLRVGGPVALVIGALYEVFRDIGENETFRNALESIRNTWNERIIPSFNRIREVVQDLFESEGFSNTLTFLRDEWNRIRDVIQDFVINTVSVVVDSIAGVVEGIAMMMEGDFLGGFLRISGSILEGIAGLADNVITSVLRLFGADFGENGSFRTWLDDKIRNFGSDIRELWNNFITALSDRWNRTITFLTETLPDALVMGWEASRDLIVATVNYAVTRIRSGLMESFENLKNTVLSIPDQIRLAIIENLRFSIPTIEIPIPRRLSDLFGLPESFTLLEGFSAGIGTPEQADEIRGRISERAATSAEAIAGYRSETATALGELNAARENFRTVMSTPIVVNNVDNSSTTSGSATIRYDNPISAHDRDAYIRRGLTPMEIM